MGDKRRVDLLLFAVGLLVLALDQLTKYWITTNLYPGQAIPPEGLVRIHYVTNTGAAFGLFRDQTILFVLIAAAVAVMIVIYHRVLSSDALLFRLALGLQLGGAVGNLLDRVRFGHVIDFVDVGFWPVFNLADSAIVVGVIVLGYFLLFPSKQVQVAAARSEHFSSEGDGTV